MAGGSAESPADRRARLIMELAAWHHLTPAERRASGAPATESLWCAQKGVAPKTAYNYKQSVEYTAELDKLASLKASRTPFTATPELSDDAPVAEGAAHRFELAMSALNDGLASGDAKTLDLWMRTEGKEFFDAARAQRESGLSSMDDAELVEGFLRDTPDELIVGYLAGRGYLISAPEAVS